MSQPAQKPRLAFQRRVAAHAKRAQTFEQLPRGTVPFVMFSAERWTQRVLRDVLAATVCRMAAR